MSAYILVLSRIPHTKCRIGRRKSMMPVDPAAFRSKYIWLILQEFRYLKNNGIAIWNHVPKSEVADFFLLSALDVRPLQVVYGSERPSLFITG